MRRSFEASGSPRSNSHAVILATLLGLIAVLCGGCKRHREKRLEVEDIHRITHEFVVAATAAAPPGSEVRSELRAFEKLPNSKDHIEIRIFQNRNGTELPPSIPRLLQALGAVATSHALTLDPSPPPQESQGSRAGQPRPQTVDILSLTYRHAGVITHTIHIHISEATASHPSESPPAAEKIAPARLAIILDDLGNDRAAAEAIFAMPYPLTVSILPNHVHSQEIAEQAHRLKREVMLHLPMQSLGRALPEPHELHAGMSEAAISALLTQFLNSIPGVVGVNNHQGSQSTADVKLMSQLMPILRERKLFYVDSRTSTATIAYDTAHRFGVRAGFRNVPFLDDVENVAAVRKRIALVIRAAVNKKSAIAIGHAHTATLQALREALPDAKRQGVRLVFASELVR